MIGLGVIVFFLGLLSFLSAVSYFFIKNIKVGLVFFSYLLVIEIG